MLTLLTKLFIRDKDNVKSPAVRQAYGVLCGSAGIALNLLLFGCKLLAGLLCGSIAITADAFNNLSDAGSSVITLIGFRMAGHKPDTDHPFGHGRIEYLSGLLVSIVILIMAFELVKSSFLKILHPETLTFSPAVIVILSVSILVKCYMALYNRRIGEKIDSSVMRAAAIDSLSDSAATFVVLLSTLAARFLNLQIDGWCGILVGLFIAYAGFCAARDTISPLLGQAPEPEFVERVHEIVRSYPQVLGIHDLIVHNYGPGRTLISLHAEVPSDQELLTLHETIDTIERDLSGQLHCHAVIHIDPVQVGDPETDRLKKKVEARLHALDAGITVHDFRLTGSGAHTNVIFDVAVPYRFEMSEEALTEELTACIRQENPDYRAIIEIDRA